MARRMSLPRAACLLPAAAALLLGGCAKDRDLYPSLSIRDEERVSGVFEPVEAEPYVPPAQSGEVLDSLARYQAEAAAAHRRVLAAAEQARAPLAAARGKEAGGEEWAVASIALADVEARRSETMVALAEIDRLYVAAQLEAGELAEIVSALSQVNALVLEEDRLIAGLRADLPE